MRLHRLEVNAFGPFRTRQTVDFDELSASGLFLLHGSTGAGKTSVLDAVCFALYGKVPGARAGTAALRSHYAEGDERPEVVLEFSVGPRRFEVTRSPAWERPKRRGEGTTTAQARVGVRELCDGEWSSLATRIDDAAHLLDEVLGMGPDQFTKLVMLPQGEFASFLRADAETRRVLLERIFGTDRFADVQEWLREQRARARAEVDDQDQATLTLLAQADQAAAPALRSLAVPDGAGGVAAPATVEGARDRVDALVQAVGRARESALIEQLEAVGGADGAGVIYDQAQAMAQLAEQFAALVERQEAAEGRQGEIDRLGERIERARRAQGLAALLPALAGARARHAQASVAAGAGPGGDEREWLAERDAAGAALAALAELEPVVVEHDRLTGQESDLGAAVAQTSERAARLRETVADAQQEVGRIERARADVRELAAGSEGARLAVTAARQRGEAAVERDRIGAELVEAGAAHELAREAAIAARERYLDVREQRLDSLAAELAATLEPGAPCRVCGSTAHPHPARPAPGAVDAEQERAAHRAAEQAQEQVAAASRRLAGLEAALAAVTERAEGWDAEAAATALHQARERLRTAEEAAAQLARHDEDLDQARQRHARAAEQLAHLSAQLQDLERSRDATTVRLQGLASRILRARGDHPDLQAHRSALEERRAHLQAAIAAGQELAAADARLVEVDAAAQAAAARAGFADVDQALAAVLDEAGTAQLERRVIEHRVELESVEEQLTDERFTVLHEGTAAVRDAVSLAALAAELEQARLREHEAVRRAAVCDSAFADLERLRDRLHAQLAVAAPVQERFAALDELTRCADGTGGDNALRMSLSAFVLAARLEQVAAAATQRLGQMSSGRYALVHTDAAARGRGRAGLTLEVVDAWTGARRGTGSLSGGEAFYTSLALALGLADVVAEEAGGVHLDTLFIDEGFGSLDEDTLDEVMDTLDGLRSGGRSVGIVSHLAELRQRIGTRLEVTKSARGSTLALAG